MSNHDSNPPIACTLTETQTAERYKQEREALSNIHRETIERPDGYTLVFDDTQESIEAVATFVTEELQCCSFAEYAIEVSPPYEETHLVITGPEGTKETFRTELLDPLELANQ